MFIKMVDFICLWLIVIFTFILICYAISVEYQYANIAAYPVPLCYNDWLCKNVVNGTVTEVNMSQKTIFSQNSTVQLALPLSETNICNFTFVNQDGNTVTENPGTYLNTWANVDGCNEENNYEGCPYYQVGDIYWRALWNGIEGSKYNDYNRTYWNSGVNLNNCP